MKYKTLLVLILAIICQSSFAQDRGFRTEGREFFLGYLHPTVGPKVVSGGGSGRYIIAYEDLFAVYALVSSYVDNEVSVSYYSSNGKEEIPIKYTIAARTTANIRLERQRMRHDSIGDKAAFLACHIKAKRPISIQYYSLGPNSTGSYLALPVHAWGKKHIVASYNDNPSFGIASYPGLTDLTSGIFTIVAAYDGTQVTITPTAQTMGGNIGINQGPGATGKPKPYTITLSRGQCYFVRSASSEKGNTDDISGTIVVSNKPVAVISGHEDAVVGDGGIENCVRADMRDFMIEQLIPSEFWDNTGIISIPHKDSEGPIIYGAGEDYRLYIADDKIPPTIDVNEIGYVPVRYTQVELRNRIAPIHFSTFSDTGRFMAMQYELRSHGVGAPFPAPSMNTLIPKSQWRSSYSWSFPVISDFFYSGCYKFHVTVIADTSQYNDITVSTNVTPPGQIGVVLKKVQRTWQPGSIPGFPELKAVTYILEPPVSGNGGYYSATAPFPFMVYHHGNVGQSLNTLTCPCPQASHETSYFTSYGSPGGASLFDKSVFGNISLKVDTICSGEWKICATDLNPQGGIRYVSLLDDAKGNLYAGRSFQHTNVAFPHQFDSLGLSEFTLTGDDRSVCFTIGITDPGKDAYAPVIIYDKAGNYRILELRQSSKRLIITPDPFVQPDLFRGAKLGVKICTTFTVHNEASNPTTYKIDSLTTSTTEFTLSAIKPPLPAFIAPGDSLTFSVCFEAEDTLMHRDTIRLTGACLDLRLPLVASTVRPILLASDIAFGKVLVGRSSCKPLTLKNIGQAAFMVQGGTVVQSGNAFSLDSASQAKFPFMLTPAQSVTLTACYTPDTVRTHDAWISWQTDITAPFASEHKPITNLSGEGYQEPGSVDRRALDRAISIRPNPARDKITVETDQSGISDISIVVFDILGREVAASRTLECKLPDLAAGVYYVRVKLDGAVRTMPVEVR